VIKKQRSQLRTNLIYGEVFSKSARIIEFDRKTKVCGKGIKV